LKFEKTVLKKQYLYVPKDNNGEIPVNYWKRTTQRLPWCCLCCVACSNLETLMVPYSLSGSPSWHLSCSCNVCRMETSHFNKLLSQLYRGFSEARDSSVEW